MVKLNFWFSICPVPSSLVVRPMPLFAHLLTVTLRLLSLVLIPASPFLSFHVCHPTCLVLRLSSSLVSQPYSDIPRLTSFVSRHLFLDSQTLFPLVSSLDPHKSSSSLVACPLYRSSLYLVSPPSILINRLSFLVSYLSSLVPLFYRPLSLVPPLSSFVLRLSSLVSILFSIVPRTMS
jgi:hypothetical protein